MVSHRREALTHLYCTAFDCADFIDLHPRYDGAAYALCISILYICIILITCFRTSLCVSY